MRISVFNFFFILITVWLSGSGGVGETTHILASFLENRAGFRAAQPLSAGAGVGQVLDLDGNSFSKVGITLV